MRKIASLLGVLASTVQPAIAQNTSSPTDYDRALAAGYKAQFTCSALWNGGKSIADIEADELTGIYDRIADIVPKLAAEVDQKERQVRVAYDDDMPPRTAIWNRVSGCTAMPIGFGGLVTGVTVKERQFDDQRAWPMGDLNSGSDWNSKMTKGEILELEKFEKSTGNRPLHPPNTQLEEVVESAIADSPGKTSAVLIIHKDKIVGELYKDGHDLHTAQRTWSVAKSIAGTLIGHSVQQGMVNVKSRTKLKQWKRFGDPRAFITIEDLMRMSSGLTSNTAGNRTDAIYMGGMSVSQQVPSWPLLHKPGTKFRYANNDTLLAIMAAQAEHEDWKYKLSNYMPDQHDFDPNAFFQKLGMTRTYVETDWQDNYILSSQVWTTARDLGRLGMLYLNNGEWNGERLLPEDWREFVSTPSGPQPDRQFGYGATFWLMNKSDGIPKDTFAAFGNRGQYLVIIPSMQIVIVRRGYDTRSSRFDIEAFTRDIVAALK